jgi:hypothetical protein
MSKLTVRLHNERTSELLGIVAKRCGVSKNQLIEDVLERELRAAAMVIEQDLSATVAQLRRYRAAEHQQAAIEAFARAEGSEADPVRARRVAVARKDAFGVLDAFTADA